ncbi:MAG: 4Fe-4S binding protein [Christensenellales bacterium]
MFGLGTCERACPFDAIHIDPIKQIAVVDEEKCQACKKCVAACPQHVLSMRPAGRVVNVGCHNPEKGIALKEKCDRACIGCEACVKACNFGAIEMENGVPKIDYEKCVGCMACADACPTGAMEADFETRKEAYIDPSKCVGCTMCARQCKFDAIEGALKQPHKVLGACTGCGLCAAKCPKKAITMRDRRAPRNKLDKVKKAPAAASKPAAPAAAKPAVPVAPKATTENK